jgi:transcriptional regulator with XRE-family HTH domain
MGYYMSILCDRIGKRVNCDSGGLSPVSRFGAFVREEMDRQGISLVELERRTEISDSTLSRILGGDVDEPKPSQIARIAKGLGLKFWVLMQHAGYTSDDPDNPDEETQRLAAIIAAQPVLREILSKAEHLSAEDRDAVLAFMIVLQQRRANHRQGRVRRKGSQSAPEDK